MKACSKCKVEKPLDEFHRNKSVADGRAKQCKECFKITRRKYRDSDKGAEAYRNAQARYAGTEKELAVRRRFRTSPKGIAAIHRDKHNRRAHIAAAVPQRWQKSECSEQLCYWCGVDLATVETHVEHLMPISLGGEAKSYNEAPACKDCNLSKSDTHPLVWLARMF